MTPQVGHAAADATASRTNRRRRSWSHGVVVRALPAVARCRVRCHRQPRRRRLKRRHLQQLAPEADVAFGGFDTALLDGAAEIVASPGVSLREPFLQAAAAPRRSNRRRHRTVRARSARTDRGDHRYQRQEHGDDTGCGHGRSGGQASACRRQSGPSGARSARRAGAGVVRARTVELPARHDTVAAHRGGGSVECDAGSHGSIRHPGRLCGFEGAHLCQLRRRRSSISTIRWCARWGAARHASSASVC